MPHRCHHADAREILSDIRRASTQPKKKLSAGRGLRVLFPTINPITTTSSRQSPSGLSFPLRKLLSENRNASYCARSVDRIPMNDTTQDWGRRPRRAARAQQGSGPSGAPTPLFHHRGSSSRPRSSDVAGKRRETDGQRPMQGQRKIPLARPVRIASAIACAGVRGS